MAERKTAQQVADTNLEIAERVHEKATDRLERAEAAVVKAREDLKMSERKVRAARLIALDEDVATIDPEPSAAAPAKDDVL